MDNRILMADKLPIEGAHKGIYGLRIEWLYELKDELHEMVRYNCPKKCFERKASWRKRVKAFIQDNRDTVRCKLKEEGFTLEGADFRKVVVGAGIQWSVKHVNVVDRFLEIIKYKEVTDV